MTETVKNPPVIVMAAGSPESAAAPPIEVEPMPEAPPWDRTPEGENQRQVFWDAAHDRYRIDAYHIARWLQSTIPGGTYDLLIEFLNTEASQSNQWILKQVPRPPFNSLGEEMAFLAAEWDRQAAHTGTRAYYQKLTHPVFPKTKEDTTSKSPRA